MTNVGSKRGSGLLRAEGQKQGGLRGGGANTWQGVWHGKKGGSLKSKKKYLFFFVHFGSLPTGSMKRLLQESFEIILYYNCGLFNGNFMTENLLLLFFQIISHPFSSSLFFAAQYAG